MDHHCPWINHCVGHANHAAFLKFLFFVPFGCLHGVILNVNFLYRFVNYVSVSFRYFRDFDSEYLLGISVHSSLPQNQYILAYLCGRYCWFGYWYRHWRLHTLCSPGICSALTLYHYGSNAILYILLAKEHCS